VMPPGGGARPGPSASGAADPARTAPRVAEGIRLGGWRGIGVGIAALFVAAGVLATVRLVQVDASPPADARAPAAPVQSIPSAASPQVLDLPSVAPASGARATTPAVDDEPTPARPRDRAPRPRVVAEPPPPPAPVVVEPPPSEPAPPPPIVERAPPPKSVDPWQQMGEALARCARQELFARLGCEHRVRASACDGQWGRVPQCPGGLPTDHGQ